MIIIQGKHLGGFLFIYFLLGLFFVTVPSLLMLAGTTLFIMSIGKDTVKKKRIYILSASICYYTAFLLFFFLDDDRNNIGTFEYAPSLIFMLLFIVLNLLLIAKLFFSRYTNSTVK